MLPSRSVLICRYLAIQLSACPTSWISDLQLMRFHWWNLLSLSWKQLTAAHLSVDLSTPHVWYVSEYFCTFNQNNFHCRKNGREMWKDGVGEQWSLRNRSRTQEGFSGSTIASVTGRRSPQRLILRGPLIHAQRVNTELPYLVWQLK